MRTTEIHGAYIEYSQLWHRFLDEKDDAGETEASRMIELEEAIKEMAAICDDDVRMKAAVFFAGETGTLDATCLLEPAKAA